LNRKNLTLQKLASAAAHESTIADFRSSRYRHWAKTHGAVYQIQLGNIPVVVVNSAEAAKVLFGQNAQALSSRPEFYTFHKVYLSRHGALNAKPDSS
jgi:3-hydroxyphenylacetate 6-hydroxylase